MKIKNSPKNQSIFGFTLVELIVTITILAILGTIGFITLGGFNSASRDSARISDFASLRKGLEISHVTSGKYPMPEGNILHTGSIAGNILVMLEKCERQPQE